MSLLVVTADPVSATEVSHLLDPRDAVRAGAHRDRSASSYALLRLVLQELTGRPAREHVLDRRCGACGGAHGKPVLRHPSLHVSVSSTPGLVAAAVTAAGPVGVDVEREEATAFDGFPGVVLAPGEPDGERTRTWVRKEAWLKATGTGLAVDPRTVDVSVPTPGVQVYDVPAPPGIVGAAAVLADERPVLTVERRRLS